MNPFTERETATILAALRWWQECSGSGEHNMSHVIDVATNSGQLVELSPAEIDTLCETINTGEATGEDGGPGEGHEAYIWLQGFWAERDWKLQQAAPLLLESARRFVALYPSHNSGDCTPPGCEICRCRMAIAQAEGKPC